MSHRTVRPLAVLLAVALLAVPAAAGVNSSVTIEDGAMRSGGASTVNGSIRVGEDAEVGGICETVNGAIRVGDGARVAGLRAVNGTIRVGEDVTVEDDAVTVNGRIAIDRGSRVDGIVETVNGGVELSGAEVRGVRTTNGHVVLADGSVVDGDVVIAGRQKKRWFWGGGDERKPLEIELSGGSVVTGDIVVEDPDREVTVVLRQGSEVRGTIEGAEVERK